MKSFISVVTTVNETVGRICSFIILPMVSIILLELLLRALLNHPTNWVHELSGYFLAAYCMLGGGYALLHKAHVNVDILYARFSPRRKSIISLFTWMLFFYFFIVVIWRTGEASLFSIKIWERSTSIWGPLFWPVKLLIPVGSILLLMQGISQFLEDLLFAIRGGK